MTVIPRSVVLWAIFVGSWSLVASAAHATPGDQLTALERYRPILRYDSDEDYFAQPVSLPPGTVELRPGDRVYGHVATEGGDTWLQYWLFYAYNPQDRGPLNTGRHEGRLGAHPVSPRRGRTADLLRG